MRGEDSQEIGMTRARPTSHAAKPDHPKSDDERPSTIHPPRKHPLLLALAVVLLIGWLAFLAVMAWRG